jgi:hypothetical protein
MKKRILLAISVLLVLGLGIAAFAFKTTINHSHEKASACCCKDGFCPMKGKGAATGEATSCCDSPDCCCKGGGDSCPMKTKGETSQTTGVDMKNVKVVSGDENCEKSCCKHKKQS